MIRRRLKNMVFISAVLLSFAGCTGADTKAVQPEKKTKTIRDTSITPAVSYSDLFLDSLTLERFIDATDINTEKAGYLRDFYKSRNYQFAWFTEDGLDEHGRTFWNLHNNFLNYSQDSSIYDKRLHQQMEVLINEEEEAAQDKKRITDLELSLTAHFFDYAQYAFTGKVDPKELQWHIPRKKINPVMLLDSLIAHSATGLDQWEPVNQSYKRMRQEVLRYYKLEKEGGWEKINGDKTIYREGDSARAVQQLKERLRMTGDYSYDDTTAVFTPVVTAAVKKTQKRFGLATDGVAGLRTLRELNKPVTDRIRQMLLNLERMRWMPAHSTGKRLVANIPEFKLHVYEDNKVNFSMRIVVGKAANKTVVFNDKLKYIVFSPYWNVPRSIVRNEILPAMQRNPGYLAQHNMEKTGTRNGLPVIRQKPGGNNALGRVKFLFPNSYAIYFHDTPAKSLFERTTRAFSHGCIRLEEPKRLAAYLLKDVNGWDENRITGAMYAGSEKWVGLPEPVPVAITYFTSWVDDKGLVNFREDIYGHDKTLAAKLFD